MAENLIKIGVSSGHEEEVKTFNFPAGEVSVNVDFLKECNNQAVFVAAQIVDSDGVMQLLMVKDAIDRMVGPSSRKGLLLPYVPYARQDRVCNQGEALSIKVMADLINSMGFDEVVIYDPHSNVTTALIKNCTAISLSDFANLSLRFRNISHDKTFVAPDFGATKKVEKLAEFLGRKEVIQGIKRRDLKTGKLSGFAFEGDVEGKDFLIVDDICDGGGTFVGLTKVLKDAGANSVSLFVTHGIFSKGIQVLLDGGN